MSSLIVEVCEILNVKAHPDADLIELVEIKGWQCVSGKGQFQKGDKCVYFPPDAVISEELAERLGVAKYCPELPKDPDGTRPPGRRVKAQRFRGEPSFGMVHKVEDPSWPVGMSLIEHYGITKYEPPPKIYEGDAASPIPEFHGYTNIENIGNFPNIFVEGEEIVVTEKLHGSNCRVGKIAHPDDDGNLVTEYMAGSNNERRKEFDDKGARSKYWIGLTDSVRSLLDNVAGNVIVFGEVYGPGVQDMHYGLKSLAFRAFDISVNGRYLDYDEQKSLFDFYGVEMVPILYRGPYSAEKIAELTNGPTTMCSPELAGKFKGREGVVIKPIKERYTADLPGYGRAVLKSISVDYHARKGGTEYH